MPTQSRPQWLEMEQIGNLTVVRFKTRAILDDSTVEELGGQLYSLVDKEGCRDLLLNFQPVVKLTTPLLGKLITLNKKIQKAGGRLAFCKIHPELHEVFALFKFPSIVAIFDEEQEAVESFAQPPA